MDDLIRSMVADTAKLEKGLVESVAQEEKLLKEAPEEEEMEFPEEPGEDEENVSPEDKDAPAEEGEPFEQEEEEFEKQYLGMKGDTSFYVEKVEEEDEETGNKKVSIIASDVEGNPIWSSAENNIDVVEGDLAEIMKQIIVDTQLDQVSTDLVMRYDLLGMDEEEAEEEIDDIVEPEEEAPEEEEEVVLKAPANPKEPKVI